MACNTYYLLIIINEFYLSIIFNLKIKIKLLM